MQLEALLFFSLTLHSWDFKAKQLKKHADTDVLFRSLLWTKGGWYLQSFSSPDSWDMYTGPPSSTGSWANVNLAFSYTATLFLFQPFIIFSFLSPPRCLSLYRKLQKTFFPIPIPMSLKWCTFVWGCRGNGLIFHGTQYLMPVNSLNGAYQHNQINYLLQHWQ